jgi:hypothetical protein
MISAVKDNPYTLFEISPTIRWASARLLKE